MILALILYLIVKGNLLGCPENMYAGILHQRQNKPTKIYHYHETSYSAYEAVTGQWQWM